MQTTFEGFIKKWILYKQNDPAAALDSFTFLIHFQLNAFSGLQVRLHFGLTVLRQQPNKLVL